MSSRSGAMVSALVCFCLTPAMLVADTLTPAQLAAEKARLDTEKAQLDADKKGYEAEGKSIADREAYYAGRKVELDRESARLTAVHADITATSANIKKLKADLAALRTAYNERNAKFPTTKFPTPEAKEAERQTLVNMFNQGQQLGNKINGLVQNNKDRKATYQTERNRWETTKEGLRVEYDQFIVRKNTHAQTKDAVAKRETKWAQEFERYTVSVREAAKPPVALPGTATAPLAKPKQWVVIYAHNDMKIGHTFVAWINEDEKQKATVTRAVGFYPGAGALPNPVLPEDLDVFTWMIAGAPVPGEILDEFKRWNPASEAYVTVAVSPEVFKRTQALISDWRTKPYRLTVKPNNCIDFVAAVAKELGLKLPNRNDFTFPAGYAAKLRELNR